MNPKDCFLIKRARVRLGLHPQDPYFNISRIGRFYPVLRDAVLAAVLFGVGVTGGALFILWIAGAL
jgi:hypothetical protein